MKLNEAITPPGTVPAALFYARFSWVMDAVARPRTGRSGTTLALIETPSHQSGSIRPTGVNAMTDTRSAPIEKGYLAWSIPMMRICFIPAPPAGRRTLSPRPGAMAPPPVTAVILLMENTTTKGEKRSQYLEEIVQDEFLAMTMNLS